MKAIRIDQFGGEENLKLHSDCPVPKPAEDEVLIKLQAAGINPFDTIIRQGTIVGIKVPYIPGIDGAGIVEEVGTAVKRFHKGDRVIVVHSSSGTYAEYCISKENYVCSLHKTLSFEQGASIGIPYYTAFAAIHGKAKSQKRDLVLVHGASGAVGIAAIQILKAHGCRVIGTAGTPEGQQLVKNQGADYVFCHREENYMKRIMDEVTDGQGVNVILEMLASINLQADLEIMAFRGCIVVIGSRGRIKIDPELLINSESVVMGLAFQKTPASEFLVMHTAIELGQASGWVKPVVGKVYPLEDASKGHYDVINNSGTQGKLVLNVTS